MKDDILKFRKLCKILVNEKEYTVNKISIESGINWPTMKKILEDDINTLKLFASNLGKVQDFIHKHCEDIRLAGIEPDYTLMAEKQLSDIAKNEQNLDLLINKETFHSNIAKQENEDAIYFTKGKRKYTKKEHLPKEASKHIKSGKTSIPDSVFQETINKEKQPEKIPIQSLVEIILFLRMEAMKYRELAESFDISANQLEKTNLK